jgi:hypothetical protein
MNKEYKLALILPLYNPHTGWKDEFIHSLNKLQEELTGIEYCITIVNDGSTFDIGDFVETRLLPFYKNLNYLTYPENQGKGYAIRYGIKRSSSDYYIYSDFDFPFGLHSIKQAYEKLAGGEVSLVIGTRSHTYLKVLPYGRRFISLGLMIINTIITRFRVSDTQAGLKGLDEKAREILLTTKTNTFTFEMEFILKCLNAKLLYSFVKVLPNSDIKFSNFSLKTIIRELKNYIKIIFGRK